MIFQTSVPALLSYTPASKPSQWPPEQPENQPVRLPRRHSSRGTGSVSLPIIRPGAAQREGDDREPCQL